MIGFFDPFQDSLALSDVSSGRILSQGLSLSHTQMSAAVVYLAFPSLLWISLPLPRGFLSISVILTILAG